MSTYLLPSRKRVRRAAAEPVALQRQASPPGAVKAASVTHPLTPVELFALQRTAAHQTMQRMLASRAPSLAPEAEAHAPVQRQENRTGLPDSLKSRVEALSGHSLDDIRVHYNSPRPAQVQAHSYTQGSDIHVAPGQERHLPHEAWHAVQQKEGRVQATSRLNGAALNDSPALEREADLMGARAGGAQPPRHQQEQAAAPAPGATRYVLPAASESTFMAGGQAPVQRVAYKNTAAGGGQLDVTIKGSNVTAEGWIGQVVKPTGFFAFLRSATIEKTPVGGSLDFHEDNKDATRLVIGTVKSYPKRTGAGTLLVSHLLEYARARGYTTIGTDLSALEEGTPEFYQSIGLKPPEALYKQLDALGVDPNSKQGKNILFAGRLDGSVKDVSTRVATKLATSPWKPT